ncbi:MAG TPA: bifunctional diaminohydroxyphosphoribosylaminopyrimidine deaminase/5-amino-6-(5-phosphoribosylamino)uracil reductase RibD [Candidatus Saccharimonadales bacterium]|nr:bifunctional diaminohydroxyphosphoribosylaminopyrimidine deaminase/5-amino-6-(5-phosphoribosylamino)uracil reductase RibD [Candidatus Saccharimonadales bacterium]
MDETYLNLALRLARRGFGRTSPNPMVGAVLVKNGRIIGEGWHHRAGEPHAEIEALRSARQSAKGAALFITLEPCCTHGRTPPCTDAIIAAGIQRVVVAALDPNPAHQGKGLEILERAGISIQSGLWAERALRLNEAFNHWIVHRTPFVTVKAAMSLDGKIATRAGESKWITGEKARAYGMTLRAGADAILVGVNTIIHDDPNLNIRKPGFQDKALRRFILDPTARTPLRAKVVSGDLAASTTIVVTKSAAPLRVAALQRQAQVLKAPQRNGGIDLPWLLRTMGKDNISSLLVEGGGETNAAFLEQQLVHRVAFFYAPLVLGGDAAPKAVGGAGVVQLKDKVVLQDVEWRQLGPDLLLTARVAPAP